MDNSKIKETLEKQLQLLSKRSEDACETELAHLSRAMVEVAKVLILQNRFSKQVLDHDAESPNETIRAAFKEALDSANRDKPEA